MSTDVTSSNSYFNTADLDALTFISINEKRSRHIIEIFTLKKYSIVKIYAREALKCMCLKIQHIWLDITQLPYEIYATLQQGILRSVL